MSSPSSPKLKAAGLWQRTSANGNIYFAGRLGGVRILIFENRDRAGEDEPSHHLFFVDGETRSDPPRANTASAPRRQRRATTSWPQYYRGSVDADPNDPVSDLWPEKDR
jgi:hypothetical protein